MVMLAVFLAALFSFLTSLLFVRKSGMFGLLDMPNMRSLHTVPTPRGGGIGIVLGMAVALSLCWLTGVIGFNLKYAAVAGGFFAMALLGFCSDRFSISSLTRIIFQVLITVIMVWLIGCPKSLIVAGLVIPLGGMGAVFSVIWLVAATNFYNFMDGIDGLAAMQGIIAGIGIASFGLVLGDISIVAMGLALSGATAGFLALNFPPAKIFMGDTGSYALGIFIASFSLLDNRLMIPVALVLSVFVFDAGVVLVKRVLNGEEWYLAHKSHFYQRAVKMGHSHLRVTAALSAVIILLTVFAYIYLKALPLTQLIILAISLTVLIAMALWFFLQESKMKRS